ncbi:flagellar hook-length control protein FliK [Geothrix limicola]|nr:flagellar hook-length control protein FliK [Geothrix limicola]
MAQFVQPPTPPKAPEHASSSQAKSDRDAKVRAPEDRADADSLAPVATDKPSPKPGPKAASSESKKDPSASGADAAKPSSDTATSSTDPSTDQPMPVQKGVVLQVPTELPLIPAAPSVGTGPASLDASAAATKGAQPSLPSAASEAASATKAAGAQAGTLSIQWSQAAPAAPKAEPATTPLPAAPPVTLPAPAPAKAEAQVQPDPAPATPLPAAQVVAQAVLAEPETRSKETPASEALDAAKAGAQADPAPTSDKPAKLLDAPAPARQGPQEPPKANAPATPLVNAQETTFAAAKANAQPMTGTETTPAPSEGAASKPGLSLSSTTHTPDGSAFAALNALSRTAESAPASATAAAPPAAPATPPASPVLQVEGGLKWMLKGGVQEAQLQLHPDSLGQVTIHLKVEGGEVHARLWVTEPGSVQAVQEGRPHLEMSLKEQGLQLGSFDLHQGHRPFQEAPSAPSFREPAAADLTNTRQEAPVTLQPSILNPHRVELYA